MADSKTFSADETIGLIRDIAKADGDDFRVKISRRDRPSNTPDTLAVLDRACVEHFVYPETWLTRLFGGAGPQGVFLLTVYHAKDPSKSIGMPLVVAAQSDPKKPVPSAVNAADWKGPTIIHWMNPGIGPSAQEIAESQRPMASIGGAGMPPMLPPSPFASFGPPTPLASPQSSQMSGHGGPSDSKPETIAMFEREQRVRLEEQLRYQQAQQQMAQYVHAIEEQNRETKRVAEQARADMERRISELAIQRAPVAPTPSLAEQIAALLPAIGPIFSTMQAARAAEAQAMRELAKAERESARESSAQQMKMMELMFTSAKNDNPGAKMIEPVVAAMAQMTNMMTQNMMSMAEIQNMNREEGEPTALKVVREIGRGVAALAAASSASKRAAPPMAPQALPPAGAMAQAPQQFQAPARPMPPPRVQAMNGAPSEAPPEEEGPPTIVDEIEEMIRRKENPSLIAKSILSNLNNEDMKSELDQYEGNITLLFQDRCGDWLAEDPTGNAEYIGKLLEIAYSMAEESGISLMGT